MTADGRGGVEVDGSGLQWTEWTEWSPDFALSFEAPDFAPSSKLRNAMSGKAGRLRRARSLGEWSGEERGGCNGLAFFLAAGRERLNVAGRPAWRF